MVVYRDQLREVDKDRARGLIADAEAERLRTEIARRVLEADRALQAADAAAPAPRRGAGVLAALVLAAVVLGGSGVLYLRMGAPGYPDLPLAARLAAAEQYRVGRPRQAEAEAQMPAGATQAAPAAPDYVRLVEQVRAAVAERPDDLEGHRLLARHEAILGNFGAAHAAQARVVALLGPEATADDHARLAELMIFAAGGYVSPEAEAALAEALSRDPGHRPARYYTGLMFAQIDRADMAFRLWRPLMDSATPADLWAPVLRAQIGEVAAQAGLSYEPPATTTPGPTAEQVEAAADMTPEDRAAMVRGMVDRLAERLASDGGSAEEWARLIRGYGVLGETERARAIWAEAASVFAPRADDLETVRAAARAAGVAD
jgi:cytochrome c-type biogenesis protein CcmH